MTLKNRNLLNHISKFWNSNEEGNNSFLIIISLLTGNTLIEEETFSIISLKIYGIPINLISINDSKQFDKSYFDENICFVCQDNKIDEEFLKKNYNKNSLVSFLSYNEQKLIIGGCDINDFSIYKIFINYLEKNEVKKGLLSIEQVDIFINSLNNSNFDLTDFSLSQIMYGSNNYQHPRSLIKDKYTNQLLNLIESELHEAILLMGNSASGKTSIALQAIYLFENKSELNKSFYINSHVLDTFGVTKLLIDLFKLTLTNQKHKFVVVIDDLHSNIHSTKKLFNLIKFIESNDSLSSNLTFVGISWIGFLDDFVKESELNIAKLKIFSEYLEKKILNRITLSHNERQTVLDYVQGNLLLLSEFIKLFKLNSSSVEETIQKLPSHLFSDLRIENKSTLKRIVYLSSILGKYEIDITENFLLKKTESKKNDIEDLIHLNILRRRGGSLTLGHRTYCDLINQAIQNTDNETTKWFIDKSYSTHADIILDFLSTQKSNRIFSIIQKLYRQANLSGLRRKQNIIFRTWECIDLTINRVLIQQKSDPTWENTLSSAMFAVNTLASIGYKKEAKSSLNYIRSLYDSDLNLDLSNEANGRDFKKIKQAAIDEDKLDSLVGEKGNKLNEIKFYKNWAKGVILSAEGVQRDLSDNKINNLCSKLENQIKDKEYYYPLRVPWCTSRVLIGLGLCGRNIENSVQIRKVSNWLLNHPNKTEKGVWRSGTGNWNSWIEATSLSVLALLQVGIDKSDINIKNAVSILYAHKDEWILDGNQIDGVTALQAYINSGGDFNNVDKEISYFSNWMLESLWAIDNKSHLELLKQSCAVAQISSGLTEVMWQFLQEDLPSLIQNFEVDEQKLKSISVPVVFISYSWDIEEDKEWVHSTLVPSLIKKYGKSNVIFDIKDMMKFKDNYHFIENAIREADVYLPVCSHSYKSKANSRTGTVGIEVKHMTEYIEYHNKIVFPILKNRNKKKSLPDFLSGQFYVDFVNNDFDTAFDELIKLITTKIYS